MPHRTSSTRNDYERKLTMIGLIFIVALCKCEYQRLWTFARNLLLVNFEVLVLF